MRPKYYVWTQPHIVKLMGSFCYCIDWSTTTVVVERKDGAIVEQHVGKGIMEHIKENIKKGVMLEVDKRTLDALRKDLQESQKV